MSNSIYGILMALTSAISWAISVVLYKKLGKNLKPIALNSINAVLSFLGLLLIVFITKSNISISGSNLSFIAMSGVLGIVIGDSLFYASLNHLSPIMLSVISITGPLFSGIFGLLFFDEIPTNLTIIGMLIILAGTSIILYFQRDRQKYKTSIIGVIYALMAMCLTSYSMVLVKPVLTTSSPLVVAMYRMLFSSIALICYAVVSKKIFVWLGIINRYKISLKLIIVSAISTIGGFWCSLTAIKNCELVVTSSILSLEPFFIMLIMILLYKYVPKIRDFISIIMIIAGIILLCID